MSRQHAAWSCKSFTSCKHLRATAEHLHVALVYLCLLLPICVLGFRGGPDSSLSFPLWEHGKVLARIVWKWKPQGGTGGWTSSKFGNQQVQRRELGDLEKRRPKFNVLDSRGDMKRHGPTRVLQFIYGHNVSTSSGYLWGLSEDDTLITWLGEEKLPAKWNKCGMANADKVRFDKTWRDFQRRHPGPRGFVPLPRSFYLPEGQTDAEAALESREGVVLFVKVNN